MYALGLVLAASNSKTTTTTGGSAVSLLFILVLFAAAYFLFIRPRSMAARRQRETLTELGPGDEVLTGAGIFGTVLDVLPDRVTIETAPGTRITVLRSTIARRITQTEEEPAGWHDEELEGVSGHDDSHTEDGGAGHEDGGADEEGHEEGPSK